MSETGISMLELFEIGLLEFYIIRSNIGHIIKLCISNNYLS